MLVFTGLFQMIKLQNIFSSVKNRYPIKIAAGFSVKRWKTTMNQTRSMPILLQKRAVMNLSVLLECYLTRIREPSRYTGPFYQNTGIGDLQPRLSKYSCITLAANWIVSNSSLFHIRTTLLPGELQKKSV